MNKQIVCQIIAFQVVSVDFLLADDRITYFDECRFSTRQELLSKAQEILENFSDIPIENYKVNFERARGIIEENPQPQIMTLINTMIQKINKHPFMKTPQENGLIDVVYGSLPICASTPCAISNRFMVLVPRTYLTNLFEALSLTDFNKALFFILAHELSHHIYNTVLRQTHRPPPWPAGYHLTVDGIGILLSRSNFENAIFALEKTAPLVQIPIQISTTQQVSIDIDDRIHCLKNLE